MDIGSQAEAQHDLATEYDAPEDEPYTSPDLYESSLPRSSINSQDAVTDSEPESPINQAVGQTNPTFQRPPRFKASELAENALQGQLPDAFSPQRRGAKYVPGGLAAELRDWLVQVKGGSEYDRPAGSSVELAVDEVKSGAGMWIVAARQAQEPVEDGDVPVNAILAGDGRITGLGEKRLVTRGSTVSIAQPVWDITLADLGKFAVACDWETTAYKNPV